MESISDMESTQELSRKQQAFADFELIDELSEHLQESSVNWQAHAAEGIRYMEQEMGLRLTAYILGDATVADLEELQNHPQRINPCVAKKVSAARSVFESITEIDGSSIARHWFISTQPELDDVAPAEVLNKASDEDIEEDFNRIWTSANHFLGMSDN